MILRIRKDVKFNIDTNSDIAHYIGDELTNEQTYEINFDDLCYRLATMIFDAVDDYLDMIHYMNEIKRVFGKEVLDKVLRNLKHRNHDT